jgi:plastocyanin
MSGQNWSITISGGSETTPASFVPDVFTEGAPQTALQAQEGDIITWNNQTQLTHQPWQTDSSYQIGSGANVALCDPVPSFRSSQPGYVPGDPGLIYYACKTHPTLAEHGQINVLDQQ